MINLPLKRGMNFDHHCDVPGKHLAQEKYIKIIKEKGFDHIRLPLIFDIESETNKPCEEYFERIKTVAQMVVDNDMYAIVDVHPLANMQADPHGMKGHLYKLWEDMAEYLKDMDEKVIFEIYNEPDDPFNWEILNEVQNECIRRIRKSNPTRLIAAASAHCNTFENLCHLVLPEDDENIFVTVHDYTPMPFTHQAAWWMKDCPWPAGTPWGTEEEYQLLEDRVKMAADWGKEHNRRLHLGEFGVIASAEDKYRAKWTRHMRELCEKYGMAWCYWDFSFSYTVYDLEKDEWNEEILDALINP